MAKPVNAVYGDALFQLALEEGKLQEMKAEVETLRQVFIENEELSRILTHPDLDKNAKVNLM